MTNYPHPEAIKRTHKLLNPQAFDELIHQLRLESKRIPNTPIEFGTSRDGEQVYTLRDNNAD